MSISPARGAALATEHWGYNHGSQSTRVNPINYPEPTTIVRKTYAKFTVSGNNEKNGTQSWEGLKSPEGC